MMRRTIAMAGLGMALAMGVAAAPSGANASKFFIQAPDGGDCQRLGGTWKGSTCTMSTLNVRHGQSLAIRRDATVYVRQQLVNFGDLMVVAGNPTGTWDGTRDVPRQFPTDLTPGAHSIQFRVRDWRGGGGMVGPVYFTRDPSLPVF